MSALAPFLPGFLVAYAILLVAALSPGPAVALLLGIATGQGRGPALIATAGIASASVVLNLLTLAGIGLILREAAWAISILRVIGGAYLLWLAYGAFRKALDPPDVTSARVAPAPAWRHYAAGFFLQVSNPKAIVFWLAINAVGATAGGGPAVIVAFVLGAAMISFLCHGFWAVLLSSRPMRRLYASARRWIEALLGGFFVYAGLRLATERI